MSTQLLLIADERGFTVQLSTTHRTQAGALAHFTEVLAQLHHQHPATKAAKAPTADLPTTAANAEASGLAQPPINPFTRPRPAYRGLDNGREEPPF